MGHQLDTPGMISQVSIFLILVLTVMAGYTLAFISTCYTQSNHIYIVHKFMFHVEIFHVESRAIFFLTFLPATVFWRKYKCTSHSWRFANFIACFFFCKRKSSFKSKCLICVLIVSFIMFCVSLRIFFFFLFDESFICLFCVDGL